VTTKSSIRNRGVLYQSGAYAWKVLCLTLGGLLCALDSPYESQELSFGRPRLTAEEKSAEG
jgi:hypothetical protein